MTREEMLTKLHTIPVTVRITALVSECALECQYMTSKGTKEEWIGINEWPVSVTEDTKGEKKYLLNIEGKKHIFDDYQSFSSFFEQNWIGEVAKFWEEYQDIELEEWLELIAECDGIPFSDIQ